MTANLDTKALRALAKQIDDAWAEYERRVADGTPTVDLVYTIRRMEQSMYDCTTALLDAVEENEKLRSEIATLKFDMETLLTRLNHAEHSRDALKAEVERLREAILWALGERGNFRLRGVNEGAYWWRSELRKRAALRSEGEVKS